MKRKRQIETEPGAKEAEAKIAELQFKIARLENDLTCKRMAHEALQKIHFEQSERMTRELNQARRALKSVVAHCLPPTISLIYLAQFPAAAPAWKEAAAVLCGGGCVPVPPGAQSGESEGK